MLKCLNFPPLRRLFSATRKSDLEHVTPYIWRNIEDFNVLNFEARVDASHIRLTVDYEEDLEVIRRITDKFSEDPLVGYEDIVAFLIENPKLSRLMEKSQETRGTCSQQRESYCEEHN